MRYRTIAVFLIVAGIAIGVRVFSAVAASEYFVAPGGSDSNPGTEARPFRTIGKGVSVLNPGDTLYVREGVYYEQVVISRSGTAGAPIVVAAYPGEHPVIDGQGTLPPWWDYLLRLAGDRIVVDGLEIRNSAYCGVEVTGSHNQALRLDVHHCQKNGILVTGAGDHNLVEGCRVWWTAASNEFGQQDFWTSGLSAARHPSCTILRNNVVYNNWGEGLSTYEADHTTIEGNVVWDNWSVNLYTSDAPYVLIQRNLVYGTGDSRFYNNGRPAVGIAFCDEKADPISHDVRIVNNLVMGGNRAFYFWSQQSGTGLQGFLIAYNTFVNSQRATLFQVNAGTHRDTRIENNIFLQEGTLPVANVSNDPGLRFSHNLWSKTPTASASSAYDVIGDPRLARTGSTGPGALTAEWFRVLASSPARDRARAIAEVTEDFWQAARGGQPDIGAHEYAEPSGAKTPAPTVTSTPRPTSVPTKAVMRVFFPFIVEGELSTRFHDISGQ